MQTKKEIRIRKLTVTAILSAASFVLMCLDFPIPALIPGFVKFDFSDLPALLAAYAIGPVSGVTVALLKNLLHLIITDTGGVGELSNFLLTALFVFPAGLFYHIKRNRKSALLGALIGAFVMAGLSLITNYYVVYPIYYVIYAPQEIVLKAYSEILPVESMFKAILIFNVPFNLAKGLINTLICFLIYKKLSPILTGRKPVKN